MTPPEEGQAGGANNIPEPQTDPLNNHIEKAMEDEAFSYSNLEELEKIIINKFLNIICLENKIELLEYRLKKRELKHFLC